MDMNQYIKGYSLLVGVCAGYLTKKVLDKKTEELVEEGGYVNAFLIGAGIGSVVVTVACASTSIVANVLTELNC